MEKYVKPEMEVELFDEKELQILTEEPISGGKPQPSNPEIVGKMNNNTYDGLPSRKA